MSAPIDHAGKSFGCFYVVSKASSVKPPSGGTVGVWNIRCKCGREKTMRAQRLTNGNHYSCGAGCSLRWDAMKQVKCTTCNAPYSVLAGSLQKNSSSQRSCRKCSAHRAGLHTRGRMAHNRLQGDVGSFNMLFGRYKKTARDRGIEFLLDADNFRTLTKQDCHYCGAAPSQVMAGKKGKPTPYIYNGVDRLDSTQPYVVGNVVGCCSACNYMKSDLDYLKFIERVKLIASRFASS